ncbi:uncharacterized protein LOC135390620 isoform X2 [Ornithodoros turicata]|uniref:uncharacterized protein LOC135390620 isoform X2 n=1 Tax=Ornithodoros turicata TaxID=34597 RepID=UPI0031394F2A
MLRTGEVPDSLHDPVHGVQMGVSNDMCDNGKDYLYVDYNGSKREYTCNPKIGTMMKLKRISHKPEPSRKIIYKIDKSYMPRHYCMYERIIYDTILPTHEGHRPLWPVFGEYQYVPQQRWLHSIEHGATVMLYHPCTPKAEVRKLRSLVKKCVWKHIISPYRKLTLGRPLALVAWGISYEMSTVDERDVVRFIRRHALKGPEGTLNRDGQYDYMLLKKSEIPKGSDRDDKNICPFFK